MPKFQRRHYTEIAGILADLRSSALDSGDLFALETLDQIRDLFTSAFAADNRRFSPDRFRSACETIGR